MDNTVAIEVRSDQSVQVGIKIRATVVGNAERRGKCPIAVVVHQACGVDVVA